MFKSKILIGLVLLLYVLFVFFEISGKDMVAFYFDCLIIPLITLIYLTFVRKKNKFFFWFLLLYSIADIYLLISVDFVERYIPKEDLSIYYEYEYYIATTLYILAYLALFLKIAFSVSLEYIFKNFKIHLLVLLALNTYLVYVLYVIVEPNFIYQYEYIYELVYNIVMLMVLSASLINFFYMDNKKALYLFIGSLCIIFSEISDIAYIYITQRSLISLFGTTFTLFAFYFYFQQSKIMNRHNGERSYMIAD